jgi:phosphatidate cytidylyltransferase
VSTLHQRDPGTGGNLASDAARTSNLVLRTASAAVLIPAALGFIYWGGWPFLLLCAAAAAGILVEWTQLVTGAGDTRVLLPGLAALVFALILTGSGQPDAAAGCIVIGAVLGGGAMAAWPRRLPARNLIGWSAGGILYAGIAFLGAAALRQDAKMGLTAVLFLAATVWSTDIFAYCVGRAVGGPLLWPKVTPNKTWAGVLGGLIGGVAAGTLVAYASGIDRLAVVGVIALLLSVLSQAGDLFESAVKRRFGAKDTSTLIPGHGGLMDRLDGFLVAAFAALLVGILHQSAAAPAQGLLVW